MSKKSDNNTNGGQPACEVVRGTSVCSCGGQALMEGILMIGPKGECTVVRDPEGKLVIKEKRADPLTKKNKFFKLPFVRGVVGVVDSLKRGMNALFDSAEIALTEAEKEAEEENKSKFEKWIENKLGDKAMSFFMGISVVLAVGLSLLLFMVLPLWLSGLILPAGTPGIVKNLVEGLIRLLIFFGYMAGIAAMKDIRRVYMYHGAEHKTITCFERGYDLTVENVRTCIRFHPRCGTAFLFVVVAISILVTSLVPRFGPELIANGFLRFLANLGVRLVLLPFIMGISYEFNRFCSRHENVFTRILRAPGLFMQRFTTREPDDSMIEVAIVALGKALEYEGIDVDYERYIPPEPEIATGGDAEDSEADPACGAGETETDPVRANAAESDAADVIADKTADDAAGVIADVIADEAADGSATVPD